MQAWPIANTDHVSGDISDGILAAFQPATRRWFEATFARPTPVQAAGWKAIAAGAHALLLAPTGSGKTLAAFLWCLDRLGRDPAAEAKPGVRVIYVSPLKALAYDIERNLRAPLAGIARAAESLGLPFQAPRIAVRTGDTPARERRELRRDPAHILITTPESLYLMLGSAARDMLRACETVIVDEIHALAPGKRGAHLALSLERLAAISGRDPQRIGLSATQRPLDEIGRFLGGDRPVTLVDTSEAPRLDLTIEVPVDEMEKARSERTIEHEEGHSGAPTGIWAAIHPRLCELVRAHRSTIVFANSRRLCERLAQGINDLAGEGLVRAHHGSVSRAQRLEIEEMLKAGQLRGLVATSSLELGIDMAAVDLVVQIESPGSVARGLQRIGRAGHQVGARSTGRIFPKHRADLLEAAVVARRMLEAAIEPTRVPRNPLDVLAQQIVAIVASVPEGGARAAFEAGAAGLDDEGITVARLEVMVKRAYPFASLSHDVLAAVLDMLAGRYPSDEFADLRPRLTWDRATDRLTPRRDARLIALLGGGTIPDRGLFAVHLGPSGPRIGELDEEMVYESRVGETFLLGATTWRIAEITRDRVIVTPAPGEPGKMPFWRGDGPGRPLELGRALGAFVRELGERSERAAVSWLASTTPLDARAARNLWRYVSDQREATGTLPTDRDITVERFRDELGDFRICILSPFGARVHAPWALALEARLGTSAGFEVQTLWSDDGIVLRFAGAEEPPALATLLPEPEEIEDLVLEQLTRSALFATHFRENAARALLLPRRRPNARSPLWAQRLKAQTLMAAALRYPGFPIVLETYRECLQDVFDLPALQELLAGIRRRDIRVVEVDTASASPFARSLAFAYVAAYMYEGDAPLAERRAQALTLDRQLLRELLGQDELAALLDPAALDEVEAELQAIDPERRVRHADGAHDLLRRIGDLTEAELVARADAGSSEVAGWLQALAATHQAARVRVARQERWIAAEDLARYRDALGVQPPAGTPLALLEPAPHPLHTLIARWARTHGPFVVERVAARFGLTGGQVDPVLRALAAEGRLVEGHFRVGGASEWCDAEVMRVIRRRTLARLRSEVAPVEAGVLARFLPGWHGVGSPRRGSARLREVVEQLEGAYLPFSDLERMILPARVRDFTSAMLDELGALGELVWIGGAALGGEDGRVALYRRDHARLLLEPRPAPEDLPARHRALLGVLETQGASFFAQLSAACPDATTAEVLDALWDLVWAGLVTNDTFQPLRALTTPRRLRAGGRNLLAQAAGRWSTVASLLRPAPVPTEAAHARAVSLLERYGVVSREAVVSEGLPGGFAALSPVFRALEDAGKIRRGHFVEGLTGAQFAHAGAVDRLRAARDGDDVVVLAAVDPANPYGALIPWPASKDAPQAAGAGESAGAGQPRRAAGARVVLVHGVPALYVERGGRRLRVFSDDGKTLRQAVEALRRGPNDGRRRSLRVENVNGSPALKSGLLGPLRQAGFRMEPNALVLDPAPDTRVQHGAGAGGGGATGR
ncbi:MAG TPA: DEAD/DEAH box helicase [Polyangia bacterium]|nr:DEAD/DEAH box helicase [Polyangia bacterium]